MKLKKTRSQRGGERSGWKVVTLSIIICFNPSLSGRINVCYLNLVIRVSKCCRCTVVRRRKILLTLHKMFRFRHTSFKVLLCGIFYNVFLCIFGAFCHFFLIFFCHNISKTEILTAQEYHHLDSLAGLSSLLTSWVCQHYIHLWPRLSTLIKILVHTLAFFTSKRQYS